MICLVFNSKLNYRFVSDQISYNMKSSAVSVDHTYLKRNVCWFF